MAADIDDQIESVLMRLGDPEPPLDLRVVRAALELDFGYYTAEDPGLLQDTVSRCRVAGTQVLARPAPLIEAVRQMDLRALYLSDQQRIMLRKSHPEHKHRRNKTQDMSHSQIAR